MTYNHLVIQGGMAVLVPDDKHPHSLIIHIPFPTHRLAKAAQQSIAVDEELSTLVTRSFALVSTATSSSDGHDLADSTCELALDDEKRRVLQVHYKATTPRMLRVAVNSFFDTVGLVLQVMEELDVDVLHEKGLEGLEGVQGIEQGITGSAAGVGG